MCVMIGVDPGVSGALVALDGSTGTLLAAWPLPVLGGPKRRRIDALTLSARLDDIPGRDVSAYIEELVPMPGRGATGAQSSGILYGAVLAILQQRGVSITEVRSMKWQKPIGGLPTRPLTPKGMADKDRRRRLAEHRQNYKAALTSKARFACGELARRMDNCGAKGEGLADAYWIARYGLREQAAREPREMIA